MTKSGLRILFGLRVLFGQPDRVRAALQQSRVSDQINTAFVEPENGTDHARPLSQWLKRPSVQRK